MAGSLVELLEERAADEPDRPVFLGEGGDVLTRRQWDERSNAFAHGLPPRGVRPGDRVALAYDNARWFDYVVAWMGVLKAGAVAVPLSSRFGPVELDHIRGHAEPVGSVGPPDLLVDVGGWRARHDEVESGRPTEPTGVRPGGDDLADILYTSGTTGLPKGVATTHANLLGLGGTSAGSMLSAPGTGDRPPVLLHAFPVSTFAGSHGMVLLPLGSGLVGLPMARFDPDRCAELVERHRVALVYLVPAMGQLLLRSGALGRHDVSSVKVTMWGGSAMPPAALRGMAAALPDALHLNIYGLTEGGPAVTVMPYDPTRPEAIGRATGEGVEIGILDPDGRRLGAGEEGEICLRLPDVPTRSYYRDPETTAQVFGGGWVHTGDVGYLDPDGYLYLVDRQKDLIIRGGYNISCVEVENALHEHPAVAEAAVLGVPHDVLGEDVVAAVVLSGEATDEELAAFCAERLADYKVPRRFVRRASLPRNAMGKALKRQLRDEVVPAP
ncbi:MAG TPA: AMP-binding protein [Acidimicrobiales bacterium]|nr:AMP-binding protein [Acidimicrobiales bacterium]